MRVLMIEDDYLVGSATQKSLARFGYAVDWVTTGKDACPALKLHRYDCVLLDLGLPDISGEAIMSEIRHHWPDMPVVVTTARGCVDDRVRLIDIGADDYMVKPVNACEVAARMRALLRRPRAEISGNSEIEHGLLKLYPARRVATWAGDPVALTSKEYWLLETLVRKKNQVMTRSQLEDALYGWGEEIASNAIEVYIHFLRRKFEASLILTVRGIGYQLGSAGDAPRASRRAFSPALCATPDIAAFAIL